MHSLIFTIMMMLGSTLAQTFESGNYFGYSSPGPVPEIFAPGIVSTEYAEFAGTFTPDFSEYYFTRRGPFPEGIAQIMVSNNQAGSWSIPVRASFSSDYYEFEPYVSPDGTRVYYGSRRAPDAQTPPGNMHIWYIEKLDNSWSEPILLGSPFFERMVMYPSISNSGDFYFTGLEGIYCSRLQDGIYQQPVLLGPEINFLPLTAHSFIDPDERYLLFDGQERGPGLTDIFISYKKPDGSWTKGKSLGPEVNSGESQAMASVSPDGKCLFFTRNSDIYWVDAGIIESLKLIPALTVEPKSGNAPLTVQFSIDPSTVPVSILEFEWDLDNDGNVDSRAENPDFTYTKSGMYSICLKVIAESDTSSMVFEELVSVSGELTGIQGDFGKDSGFGYKLSNNYPNPFNPSTLINYEIPFDTMVQLTIYNMQGQEVAELVREFQAGGKHSIRMDINKLGNKIPSGIYLIQLEAEGIRVAKKLLLAK
ncbi:MAG: T9SS type A sorting domain-containing protein [Candidatus Marinimicrobia bacterium]|nr:T9SS type A sorting domain-containing protein [Candidatus Neomarinimicrobiota bacterium]